MLLLDHSWHKLVCALAFRITFTSIYLRPGSHLAHIIGQSDASG
jgi:hypothetical protein